MKTVQIPNSCFSLSFAQRAPECFLSELLSPDVPLGAKDSHLPATRFLKNFAFYPGNVLQHVTFTIGPSCGQTALAKNLGAEVFPSPRSRVLSFPRYLEKVFPSTFSSWKCKLKKIIARGDPMPQSLHGAAYNGYGDQRAGVTRWSNNEFSSIIIEYP